LRVVVRLCLLAVTFHHLRAAVRARGLLLGTDPEPAPPVAWPTVLVQLPIRDEFYVVDQALDALAALDYPRDRLRIQVLDDSTDATAARVDEKVAALRARGVPVSVVRRSHRVGFKAGALAAGLRQDDAELVAMFDADFTPEPSFLRRVVPHFTDPAVGMVQTRWTYPRHGRPLFERLQAVILDALFTVEQGAHSRRDEPFQFNGTSGIWRRRCIDDAGGWKADSLTEDLDLSLRALRRGWRFVHLVDTASPCILPPDLASFRIQQYRWAKGNAQLLRREAGALLGRSRLGWGDRMSLLTRLGRHLVHPLLMLAALAFPATTLYGLPTLFEYPTAVNAGVLMGAAGSVVAYLSAGQRILHRASWLRRSWLGVLAVPLAIGLGPTYAYAFLRGLMGRDAGKFARTPKAGPAPRRTSTSPGPPPRYRPRWPWLILVEIALAAAYGYWTWEVASRAEWSRLPLFVLFAASYGGTVIGTAVGHVRWRQGRVAAAAPGTTTGRVAAGAVERAAS